MFRLSTIVIIVCGSRQADNGRLAAQRICDDLDIDYLVRTMTFDVPKYDMHFIRIRGHQTHDLDRCFVLPAMSFFYTLKDSLLRIILGLRCLAVT